MEHISTFSTEALSEATGVPASTLEKMTHYQYRTVSDSIAFAASRPDTSSPWTNTTSLERTQQQLEREQAHIDRLRGELDV